MPLAMKEFQGRLLVGVGKSLRVSNTGCRLAFGYCTKNTARCYMYLVYIPELSTIDRGLFHGLTNKLRDSLTTPLKLKVDVDVDLLAYFGLFQ